jgi:hypothetical protein
MRGVAPPVLHTFVHGGGLNTKTTSQFRVTWVKLPHWEMMSPHQVLRNLALGKSTCYTAGRSSSSESGNVQSLAIVYFSKLWQYFVIWVAWFVKVYIWGSYSLLITLCVYAYINFNTSLHGRRLDFSTSQIMPSRNFASQTVVIWSAGASLFLIWVQLPRWKMGKNIALEFYKLFGSL